MTAEKLESKVMSCVPNVNLGHARRLNLRAWKLRNNRMSTERDLRSYNETHQGVDPSFSRELQVHEKGYCDDRISNKDGALAYAVQKKKTLRGKQWHRKHLIAAI